MKHQKHLQAVAVLALAGCMTIAPGLDMAVQRKLRPDAADVGGYLYQLIGRTIEAVGMDSLTMVFVFFAALWLANRYLFHKPKNTGVGEYLLSGFFSLMMLLCASIRAVGTVQTLYENVFQGAKVILYLLGMMPIFLCAIRGLNECLNRTPKQTGWKLWEKHPFAFPFAVLSIVWLPQMIIKYPGVLMIDSCLQMREYLNLTPRSTSHPPFGTLIYGLMATAGINIGNRNLVYFLFTLGQVAAMIAVLSYLLKLMQRQHVPHWVKLLSLGLFALSPSYAGWAVVIVKDSAYLILCLLAGTLLLDFACDARAFMKSWQRLLMLFGCFWLLILTRHNGITIVVPALLAMLVWLLVGKHGMKTALKLLATGGLAMVLAFGVNEAIIQRLEMKRATLYDWLSVPFQQTARVVKLHGDEITEQEREAIDGMVNYEKIARAYVPNNSDSVKWTANKARTPERRDRYLAVWMNQMRRYPMDYVDALLGMNSVMFDLQSNFPVFIGLSDNSMYDYVYPYSFNDMNFYESDEIRPLNSLQMALTEWYFRFSDLPVVGLFASMGFCTDVLVAMIYLAWVNKRRRSLIVYIPSVIVAVSGLFCPIVYTRYLLPMICSLPLWLGAYYAVRNEPSAPASALAPDSAPKA